jgi:hypothetical protein
LTIKGKAIAGILSIDPARPTNTAQLHAEVAKGAIETLA